MSKHMAVEAEKDVALVAARVMANPLQRVRRGVEPVHAEVAADAKRVDLHAGGFDRRVYGYAGFHLDDLVDDRVVCDQ